MYGFPKDKKGENGGLKILMGIGALVIILIGGIFIADRFGIIPKAQTVLEEEQSQVDQVVIDVKGGRAQTLYYNALDRANSDVNTRAVATTYLFDKEEDGSYTQVDTEANSTSTGSSSSYTPSTNDDLVIASFNTNYYGLPKAFNAGPKETNTVETDVFAVASTNMDLEMKIKDVTYDAPSLANANARNISVGPDGSADINFLRINNNETNGAYWLAKIGFDIGFASDVTNISKIEMAGGTYTIRSDNAKYANSESGSDGLTEFDKKLEQTTYKSFEFIFDVNPRILLHRDTWESGIVTVTADSSGCRLQSTGHGENITIYYLDGNLFQATKDKASAVNQLASQYPEVWVNQGKEAGFLWFDVETDDNTPVVTGRNAELTDRVECIA